MLLNTLQSSGHPPTRKNYLIQNVSSMSMRPVQEQCISMPKSFIFFTSLQQKIYVCWGAEIGEGDQEVQTASYKIN